MIDILAFGGGVGSWGYAALVKRGKIRVPWWGIISNTGRECPSTWAYIERHRAALPFPLIIIEQGTPSLYSGNGKTFLPGGYSVDGGAFLRGFCSAYWKRDVMRKYLVKEKGVTAYNQAFGIHTDEWQRMSKNRLKSVTNIYPLVELGITRAQCAQIALEEFGELPPRSRCWMCPGQTPGEWAQVREQWPALYSKAEAIDEIARDSHALSLFGSGDMACASSCFT